MYFGCLIYVMNVFFRLKTTSKDINIEVLITCSKCRLKNYSQILN